MKKEEWPFSSLKSKNGSTKKEMKRIASILMALVLCFSIGCIEPVQEQAASIGSGISVSSGTSKSTSYKWVKQKSTKKTKKKTKKSTKKLKKASKKTYTDKKTKKSSKSSSKVKGSTKTVTKVDTTVVTTTKYKKKSKKASVTVVTTTVTTTTPYKKKAVGSSESVTVGGFGSSVSGSSGSSGTSVSITSSAYPSTYIRTLAPAADKCVLDAFVELDIKIYCKPNATYSGYFDAGTRSLSLKEFGSGNATPSSNGYTVNPVVYHELGHFLGWIAGNVDRNNDFKAIYNAEKGNYTKTNKGYVTKDASEFFAECYSVYITDRAWLQKQCPRTCQYIAESLAKVTPDKVSSIKNIYGAYWKSIGY